MLKKIFNSKRLSVLGLCLTTVAWGASFFLVKVITGEVGLWPFLWWRFFLAAVVLVVLFPKKVIRPSPLLVRRGCVLGVLLFFIMWTQTLGLQYTTASRSGFITSLYVPFIPLMAWFILKQRATLRQVFVAILAVLGLYIMTQQNEATGLANWWNTVNPGDAWTFVTAVLCAIQIVITEKYSREHSDSVALGVWQFIWCAACFTACVLWMNVPLPSLLSWSHWTPKAMIAMTFITLIATCFAFIMQIICQKTVGSFKAGLIFALEAPFATLFAFIFLSEVMTTTEALGATIVFLTSAVPETWLKKTRGGH